MKQVILTVLLGYTVALSAAEQFRTDINPALLYHQGLLLVPQLSDKDHKHLFETEWRTKALDERATSLVTSYRNVLKMLRRAAASQVPCDWGIDMSDGPATLLPALARFKSVAHVACLRARMHLAAGNQEAAREELLATFAMARNISTDGTMISVLVQIAIENIVSSFIAENFYQFPRETLQQFAVRLNSGPPRGSIAQSMASEKSTFYDWLLARITEAEAESAGNERRLHTRVRELWKNNFAESDENADRMVNEWINATDGSAAGLINYVRQLDGLYYELTQITGLPLQEYQGRYAAFEENVRTNSNVLARNYFPGIGKAMAREFAIQAKLAMFQAALVYKLQGPDAFHAIADPFGNGPFTLRRFVLDGVDRGFELESKLNCGEHVEKLILIEKPGPAVRVDGKDAGQKIP